MNNKSKIILASALGLAAVALIAYRAYEYYQEQRHAEESRRQAKERFVENQRRQEEERQRQIRALTAPEAPSRWLQADGQPYRAAIAKTKATVVVLPPMNLADKPGLDYSSRIVFASRLAAAIAATSGAEVLDPALAYRALGEPRTLDEIQVRTLLGPTAAESFIAGTVVAEGGRMTLKLRRLPVRSAKDATFDANDLALGDALPERALDGVTADALRAFGFNVTVPAPVLVRAAPALDFPRSPLDAIEKDSDTLTGIWLQQLLGALHFPPYLAMPRPQERVFERSLAALSSVARGSADREVLQARAEAYLGRRQAALKTLEPAAVTPEREALQAYLLADLPRLTAALAKVRRPVARFISQLELFALRYNSGSSGHASQRAGAQGLALQVPEGWRSLVGLFALSFDPWDFPSPFFVKGLLEQDFAVPEYRAEQLVEGKAALGASPFDARTEAELTLSPLVHARKWREQHADQLCCTLRAGGLAQPTRAQYLDLLENLADGLVIGHLHFLRAIQGNTEQMLAQAKLYDDVLFAGGHPGVLLQKQFAIQALFFRGQLSQERNQSLAPERFDDARKILSWMPYQSHPTAWVAANLRVLAEPVAFSRGFRGDVGTLFGTVDRQPISGDLPPKPVYLEVAVVAVMLANEAVMLDFLRRACEGAILDFQPCERYAGLLQSKGRRRELTEAMESVIGQRFNGFGARSELVATYLVESGRAAEAKAMLRAVVKDSPPQQQPYRVFAELLRNDGEFEEAAKVYLAYPRLDEEKTNTVGLSNYLQPAARELMHRGAVTQARRLTEIVASYHDGSKANLEAGISKAFLRSDGVAALELLQRSYQHYPNIDTLRQIASTLFLLGQRDAAWSALATTLPTANSFSPFRAVSVGLRAAGAGPAEAAQWAKNSKSRMYWWKAAAIFQVLAQDRPAQSVDSFFNAEAEIRTPDQGIGLRTPGNLRDPQPERQLLDLQGLRAMTLGYRDFLAGRHEDAATSFQWLVNAFDQHGRLAALSGAETYWWSLPYSAYSFVKAGRTAEAQKLIEHFDAQPDTPRAAELRKRLVQIPEFEKLMINAVLAGLSGNHAEGLRFMRLAKARMPQPEQRLLAPEYVLAEIAEWMSQDTGEKAYLDLALEYARAYELYEPWAAWAYAFEARHTKDPARRLQATALAEKLDPNSRRLQQIPAGIRRQAKAWLERNRPFETRPATRESKA
jgi:hypothetical protein